MPTRPMTHCRVGHEIALSGRTKWGACSACYKTRNPGGESLRNGFCFRGHDTKISGRSKRHECVLCRIATNRKHAWNGFKNKDGSQFAQIDYDRFYQLQSGACAICKTHQSDSKKTLEVDHDHETMFVRGLLCFRCNLNLGTYEKIKPHAEAYIKKDL